MAFVLTDNLEADLFSTVLEVIGTPAVGWVDTLLGISDDSDSSLVAVQQDLVAIQQSITQLGQELHDAAQEITNFDALGEAQTALTAPLGVISAYATSGTGSGAGATPQKVPGDLIYGQGSGPSYLETFNLVLTPSTAGVPDSGQPLYRGMLALGTSEIIPRFATTVDPGPNPNPTHPVTPWKANLALLQDFFDYYLQQQAVLLTAMVEACHQGQSLNTQIQTSPGDPRDRSRRLPAELRGRRKLRRHLQASHRAAKQLLSLPDRRHRIRRSPGRRRM